MEVTFNRPNVTGQELKYLERVIASEHQSGNGAMTKACEYLLEKHSSTQSCLLTTSCTSALEMSALLMEIKPGDEIILPSYTFVSTANAFALRGATIVLVDSRTDHPGMDERQIESLITDKTRAIVPVHYAGVACDMELIMNLANKYDSMVVEDAAQAIDSKFRWKDGNCSALGSIGHLGAYSFHETKNVQCGEGGALLINDSDLLGQAEIIRENGTNRSSFIKGEVEKYDWVALGSSYLPSELSAAFLCAQLEQLDRIQSVRMNIWDQYFDGLKQLIEDGTVHGPKIPVYASNNAHMFYLVCNSAMERTALIKHLRKKGVGAAFHYQSLHGSPYFKNRFSFEAYPQAQMYTDQLVRLPLHAQLSADQIDYTIDQIKHFYRAFSSTGKT